MLLNGVIDSPIKLISLLQRRESPKSTRLPLGMAGVGLGVMRLGVITVSSNRSASEWRVKGAVPARR